MFERHLGLANNGEQTARTIVASGPDLIFLGAAVTTATALMALTSTIPMVSLSGDPLGAGLVSNLAHPGGNLTAVASAYPLAARCTFTDPVFLDRMPTSELYLSYALGGCGTAPLIARGAVGKQIGAFYAAFAGSGYRAPSASPSGLTLLVGSTPPWPRRLWFATRTNTDESMGDTQWSGPVVLPLGANGALLKPVMPENIIRAVKRMLF